ncbi:CsbD family protein [Sandarakinorhabdus sp. DWP1-3-1]|uniref:CsbD family protein n=1 Tax=Sandarakinorhabdus sp. DWP1-3-1 TaxID=2804627 RepID=UPI003CF39B60
MDKDRIDGMANQAGGKIKEGVGKLVGDKKMETEGQAQQVKGKVENAAGGVKDAVRDAGR